MFCHPRTFKIKSSTCSLHNHTHTYYKILGVAHLEHLTRAYFLCHFPFQSSWLTLLHCAGRNVICEVVGLLRAPSALKRDTWSLRGGSAQEHMPPTFKVYPMPRAQRDLKRKTDGNSNRDQRLRPWPAVHTC